MNLKKIFMLMLVALTAITSSCKYDDDELWDTVNSLADRISALETLTKQMNSDIAAMQSVISALENKVYVSQVEKLTDGYIIHFTDGTSATIKNGVDGLNGKDAPVIDVKQENGVYYWTITVDGETTWLTDEKGNKLPVSGTAGTNGTNGKNGVTPLLKVDNDGYWMVSYNNGSSYTYVLDSNGDKVYAVGPQGPAGADGTNGTNGTNGSQGKPGDSMFKSVEVEGDKVIITLNDGKDTKIELPIASGVTYSIVDSEEEVDINSIKMTSNGSVTLKYEVSKMSDVTVEVLVANGVTVSVDETKKTISITRNATSGVSFADSKVVLLYYNDEQTLTSVLKFTESITEIPSEEINLDEGNVIIANVTSENGGISVSGSGKVILKTVTITGAEGEAAIKIAAGANVEFVIEEAVTLIGGANGGDAIEVPETASIHISGTGKLTVKGNNGEDESTDNYGGSGIGYAGNGVGSIIIDGLSGLTAEGYGKHAFGIGGNTALVSISNTTIESVRGGFPQENFINDSSYGKSEPEGGAAIGLGHGAPAEAKIILDKVIVEKAVGGSKSAAIGAQYWASADITIKGSTLTEVLGGNSSAGIGGSRVQNGGSQSINILIEDSEITVTGGEYGAGIGSGYNTYCNNTYIVKNHIEIKGKSLIKAVGGKYAAGIGTGHHVGILTGSIESTVTTTGTDSGTAFYKDTYTTAQAIGYGVVDPTREFANPSVTFMVAGKVIDIPTVSK